MDFILSKRLWRYFVSTCGKHWKSDKRIPELFLFCPKTISLILTAVISPQSCMHCNKDCVFSNIHTVAVVKCGNVFRWTEEIISQTMIPFNFPQRKWMCFRFKIKSKNGLREMRDSSFMVFRDESQQNRNVRPLRCCWEILCVSEVIVRDINERYGTNDWLTSNVDAMLDLLKN